MTRRSAALRMVPIMDALGVPSRVKQTSLMIWKLSRRRARKLAYQYRGGRRGRWYRDFLAGTAKNLVVVGRRLVQFDRMKFPLSAVYAGKALQKSICRMTVAAHNPRQAFAIEDPPEHRIPAPWKSRADFEIPDIPPAALAGLRLVPLANVGEVVAYDRPDGSRALSTWDGDTIDVWALFKPGPVPFLAFMRSDMVAAYEPIAGVAPPAGLVPCICFVRATD